MCSKTNDGFGTAFDWPACFQVFSNRPNRRIKTELQLRRRTQRAFLKSRDSTKLFRRSDFRNARSVRKVPKRIDGKPMMN